VCAFTLGMTCFLHTPKRLEVFTKLGLKTGQDVMYLIKPHSIHNQKSQ
jgi:hypothetical protein